MLAAGSGSLVAVSSVGLGYLRTKPSPLPAPYRRLATEEPIRPWGNVAERLAQGDLAFRFIDAAALVRFAVGMWRNFPAHRTCLLYLFLEPVDAKGYALFERHREELAILAELVGKASVRFAWSSFGELWDSWGELDSPPWLRELVAELRSRYAVALADLGGLSSVYRRVA
jgi:hypothetical protein